MLVPSNAFPRFVGFTFDGSSDVVDRFPGIAFRLMARGVSPIRMYIERKIVNKTFADFIATVILC